VESNGLSANSVEMKVEGRVGVGMHSYILHRMHLVLSAVYHLHEQTP